MGKHNLFDSNGSSTPPAGALAEESLSVRISSPTHPTTGQSYWTDFCRFATAQVKTRDNDPAYPVLRDIFLQDRTTIEERIWRLFLYVTWYRLDSAADRWEEWVVPKPIHEVPQLPFASERRFYRGTNRPVEFLNAVYQHRPISDWLSPTRLSPDPEKGWTELRSRLEVELPHCGSWASYKLADLFRNVLDYPITAPDIGLGGGGKQVGPVPGLSLISGRPWKDVSTDVGFQKDLYRKARLQGVPFEGLEQFETTLCDFNSLSRGHYYLGHDIDSQMEQLPARYVRKWFAARARSFPANMLGERMGWHGVRPELRGLYQAVGRLVNVQ